MSVLTQEQVDALNAFARTHPHLAKVFDYLASGTKEGLGTALNDDVSRITVGETDGSPLFSGIGTITFNNESFYVTQNFPNTEEVQVNFRGTAGGAGISDHGDLDGLLDDDHKQYILVDGTRAFTGNQSVGGNRITSLGAPVVSTDAVRLQDVGPGFYGIVVKDDDTIVTTDSIKFRSRDFDVNVEGDGVTVVLNPEVKAAGFYLNPGANGVGRSLNEDLISFDISSLAVDSYFFESFVDQGFIIDDLNIITSSGSAIVGFYILRDGQGGIGVGIPGFDPISASTNKTIAVPTGNRVVRFGDSLLMSVRSNTSAKHLRGRLKIKLAG
jgi:hypothetical protein